MRSETPRRGSLAFRDLNRSVGRRGGFLLEALLAIALVLLGAAAWMAWNRRIALSARLGWKPTLLRAANAEKDSVWLQYEVRKILLKHGVDEAQVVKTYNREHRESGGQWVENILELRAPAGFRAPVFRREVERAIQKKNLGVLREIQSRGRLVFELGEADRVFERLIFHLG